jgi:hypothetical protein
MNYTTLKTNIDNLLLMLGNEIILSKENLIFYHSSQSKFEKLNRLGNWFSPINIKDKSYKNIYNNNKPLWNDGYDFRFINNKPLKLLSINTYKNDIISNKMISMIQIINENIKVQIQNYLKKIMHKDSSNTIETSETIFMKGQEDDPEYVLAYYLCKYSSFDGWITNTPYLGFCMLKYDALPKLKLMSVSTPPSNNIINYYTSKQWKEQFI